MNRKTNGKSEERYRARRQREEENIITRKQIRTSLPLLKIIFQQLQCMVKVKETRRKGGIETHTQVKVKAPLTLLRNDCQQCTPVFTL